MKNVTVSFALLVSGSVVQAFQSKPTLDCNNDHGDRSRSHFCEMREQTVSAGGTLSVDASQNGGISIKGWDRADILVRAQVRTDAPSVDQARDLARQVTVQSGAAQVRALGPQQDREHSWSVNYEIFVPTRFSANLATVNGGVSISDVAGDLEFKTVNGGLSLHRVGGYVHGRTTNGGVSIELAGDRWDGQGLDVTTTNGGVNVKVPRNYSAQLEARTTNGGLHVADGLPVQAAMEAGRRAHQISTALGAGGAMLKVTTTNGGVSVSHI